MLGALGLIWWALGGVQYDVSPLTCRPGDELRKKIETEHGEIERLQQEIQELQYLRHDSDVDDFSSASDSSLDSDDGEDVLSSLIDANLKLEVGYCGDRLEILL